MSNPTRIKRRAFVASTSKASLVFAIPTIIPGSAIGLDGATPPSDRIQLGVIGMGRRCKYVMAERTRKPTAANSTVMRRSHIACHAATLS